MYHTAWVIKMQWSDLLQRIDLGCQVDQEDQEVQEHWQLWINKKLFKNSIFQQLQQSSDRE